MCPPVTGRVLQHLVGDLLGVLVGVPTGDGTTNRTAPSAEPLDELQPVEEMRRRARRPRHRDQGRCPRALVPDPGGHREDEQSRIVLRSAARRAHLHRPLDDSDAVLFDQRGYGARVPDGQFTLTDVVGSTLGAEDEEPVQTIPTVDLEGVSTGRVLELVGAWDRLRLRRDQPAQSGREVLRVVHGVL